MKEFENADKFSQGLNFESAQIELKEMSGKSFTSQNSIFFLFKAIQGSSIHLLLGAYSNLYFESLS